MARRPRAYRIEPVPQPPPQAASWLSALGGVPITFVVSVIVTGAIFYGVTNYRMDEFKIEQTAARNRIEEERREREKVRDAFIQNATKTTELLGQMNARMAVSESKMETSNQTLNKIADELRRLNAGRR